MSVRDSAGSSEHLRRHGALKPRAQYADSMEFASANDFRELYAPYLCLAAREHFDHHQYEYSYHGYGSHYQVTRLGGWAWYWPSRCPVVPFPLSHCPVPVVPLAGSGSRWRVPVLLAGPMAWQSESSCYWRAFACCRHFRCVHVGFEVQIDR